MDIEQPLLDAARKKRRKVLLQEAGVIAMLAAGAAALLALVIVPFAAGSTTFSPLVRAGGMSGLVWAGLVIAAAAGLGGIALYLGGRHRDRDRYARFTRRTRTYDLGQLARFMNALEGVARDAGLEAPYVAVLDEPVPNTLAFAGDEGPVIGITSGALEAGLQYPEAEAVMAHQLASVVADDYLKRPGSGVFEGAALGMLWLVAVLGILAVPVTRRGNGPPVAFATAVAVVGLLILASLWLRRIRAALEHDYTLVDSIAVSMTGDRDAMVSAIETMAALGNRRRAPFPESELGLKYLFAPPRRFSENATSFLERRSRELGYALNERGARHRAEALEQEMNELLEWSAGLLADRLANLG
jgi:Zn-dependent protease with chaperone function